MLKSHYLQLQHLLYSGYLNTPFHKSVENIIKTTTTKSLSMWALHTESKVSISILLARSDSNRSCASLSHTLNWANSLKWNPVTHDTFPPCHCTHRSSHTHTHTQVSPLKKPPLSLTLTGVPQTKSILIGSEPMTHPDLNYIGSFYRK